MLGRTSGQNITEDTARLLPPFGNERSERTRVKVANDLESAASSLSMS